MKIRPIRSTINAVVAAALLSATVFAAPASATEASASLYDRLGGKDALTAVVNYLWTVVADDQRINHYFAHTQPEAFAGQLVDFLCVGAGGPCEYKGQDMLTAHTGMKLSSADFDALGEDVAKALDHFEVPAQEKGEVLDMLVGMKGDVIEH